MPIQKCTIDGKPGFQWGKEGTCYAYDPDSEESEKKAKRKAFLQGIAVEAHQVIASQHNEDPV